LAERKEVTEESAEQRRKQNEVQRVEYLVRSISANGAQRLAQQMSGEGSTAILDGSDSEDTENEDEEKVNEKKPPAGVLYQNVEQMREEDEDVLKMLARSQISQRRPKKNLTSRVQAPVCPLFAMKCAELVEQRSKEAKPRFIPNKVRQRPEGSKTIGGGDKKNSTSGSLSAASPSHQSESQSLKSTPTKKPTKWDESLVPLDWVFGSVKTIKMEESFELIANLSSRAKGLVPLQTPRPGVKINPLKTMRNAAVGGSTFEYREPLSIDEDDDSDREDLEDVIPEEPEEEPKEQPVNSGDSSDDEGESRHESLAKLISTSLKIN
jgi:hypothetical protein